MPEMNRSLSSRLDAPERAASMRLLRKFVQVNDDQSREPMRSPPVRAGWCRWLPARPWLCWKMTN